MIHENRAEFEVIAIRVFKMNREDGCRGIYSLQPCGKSVVNVTE